MIDTGALLAVHRTVARRSGSRRREWAAIAAVTAVATAWVAAAPAATAPSRWLGVAIVIHAVAMLRVPFVLFWRHDAALLARLPIDGRPLFDASLWSTAELASQALVVSLVAGLAPAVIGQVSMELMLRHFVVAAVMALATAALIPAVAVAAGALVVSGKAKQILAGLGGEVAAPPTSWLGVLPGLASASVVLAAIDVAGWLHGGRAEVGRAEAILAGLALLSVIAALVARSAADRVLPAMLRDVSALDRQQLATIEIAKPPRTLRLVRRWLSLPAALLLDKHARLIARRHPMSGVLGAGVMVTLLITAAAGGGAMSVIGTAVVLGLAYALALEARLHRPPVELPRLRDSLPFSAAQVRSASRAYVLWWWGLFTLVPSMIVLLRGAGRMQVALLVLGATGALLGMASRRR